MRLFTRTTRRLALTRAWPSYLETTRRVLDELEAAERRLSGQQAEPQGELALTAPVVFGRLHVLPIVIDGGEPWLPTEPAAMAETVSWLMVAENEIARGPNDARLHDKFGYDLDAHLARRKAERILSLMEAHLKSRQWLVLDRPTIADIACMPYLALGHEGGVSLEPYPAIRAWIGRIKQLPGFISMPAL